MGTLEGYVNAQIQPQVSGYLIRQCYQEGALVRKGQVLFEIDPRPFQAVLDHAKGQLAQAEAQMTNADINVKRDVPEAEAHAIPESQLDNDTQALLGVKAAVQADEAAVEQASLNLGYTKFLIVNNCIRTSSAKVHVSWSTLCSTQRRPRQARTNLRTDQSHSSELPNERSGEHGTSR